MLVCLSLYSAVSHTISLIRLTSVLTYAVLTYQITEECFVRLASMTHRAPCPWVKPPSMFPKSKCRYEIRNRIFKWKFAQKGDVKMNNKCIYTRVDQHVVLQCPTSPKAANFTTVSFFHWNKYKWLSGREQALLGKITNSNRGGVNYYNNCYYFQHYKFL